MDPKQILILGDDDMSLKYIRNELKKNISSCEIYASKNELRQSKVAKRLPERFYEFLQGFSVKYKQQKFALIILLGYVATKDEHDEWLKKYEQILNNLSIQCLLVINTTDRGVCEIFSDHCKTHHIDDEDKESLVVCVMKMLGLLASPHEERTNIALQNQPHIESKDDDNRLDAESADITCCKIAGRIRSAIFRDGNKKLQSEFVDETNYYEEVKYENFEENADRLSRQAAKGVWEQFPELKLVQAERIDYISNMEHFHNLLWDDKRRTTYLLLGRRGSGKSCFLHQYCRNYINNINKRIPFAIVDFIDYPFLDPENKLKQRIVDLCWNYIHSDDQIKHRYQGIRKEYFCLTPDELLKTFDYFKQCNVIFEDVMPENERMNLLWQLGELGIAQLIETPDSLENDCVIDEAIKKAYKLMQNSPWEWMKKVWFNLHKSKTTNPATYFSLRIAKNINNILSLKQNLGENKPEFVSELSRELPQEWKDDHENILKYPDFAKEEELWHCIESFIDQCKTQFGSFVLVLDNIDRLESPLAEQYITNYIFSRLSEPVYNSIKIVVSCRQSSYARTVVNIAAGQNKAGIKSDYLPIGENKIGGTVKEYYEFWLKKVPLDAVIKVKIREIKKDIGETSKLFETISGMINYPLGPRRRNIPNMTLKDMIDSLSGNNLRMGLKFFANIINYPHISLEEEKSNSIIRRDRNCNPYIVEHLAFRAIFLQPMTHYRLNSDVVNIFHIPGLGGHAGTLLAVRILELCKSNRELSNSEAYQLLTGLGYNEKDINIAMLFLGENRIIQSLPEGSLFKPTETFSLIRRYRGSCYLEKIINRLSYIEIMYFMCNIPQSLADSGKYPETPDTDSLPNVACNFLKFIDSELQLEKQATTTKGTYLFEKAARPLHFIHQDLSKSYLELFHIKKPYYKGY